MASIGIPTMHISAPVMKDPADMVLYFFRHYTSIPKGISNTYIAESVSLRATAARFGHDSTAMAAAVSNDLRTGYDRLFPTWTKSIDVMPIDKGDGRYDLNISVIITDDNDESIEMSQKMVVSSSGQVSLKLGSGE